MDIDGLKAAIGSRPLDRASSHRLARAHLEAAPSASFEVAERSRRASG
jgi:hypothetical protein